MTDAVPAVDADGNPVVEAEVTYGGFKTTEELVAAYELLKKPVEGEPAKTGDLVIKPVEGEAVVEGDDGVADALKAAGLNQDDYTKEFAETGDLSEASKTALESKGFPRAMVDVYLRGLRADQAEYSSTVFAPTGGEEGYKELLTWAGKNLSEADIDAFNATIQSGNAASAKLAVAGLVAAKNQGKAVLLNGKTNNSEGVTPYESAAQVRVALQDPRYRNDPAYRRAHEAKLRISNY